MFLNSVVPVFLGDTILDDEIEVAEYLSVLTGYTFDEIVSGDDIFFKRLNARILSISFEKKSSIAITALLTSIADKKRSGKHSKPFSIEELLEFQGLNRKEFHETKKIYNQLKDEAESVKRQQMQVERKEKAKETIMERLAKWRGLGNSI